jgi:predicted lipoprotein with Yx(FWY)xxD motif
MNKTIWAIVIIIIIVVGGWFIYQSMSAPMAPATTTGTAVTDNTQVPAPTDTSATVYLTGNDAVKGAYMTDLGNKTLYTFDNDKTPGVSSCTGTCAVAWPPYVAPAGTQGALPTGISLVARADGSQQFAYNGKPLYYYAKDTAVGQLNGDGVGGIWHIVKM